MFSLINKKSHFIIRREKIDFSFLGPFFNPDLVIAVTTGLVNPHTHLPFDIDFTNEICIDRAGSNGDGVGKVLNKNENKNNDNNNNNNNNNYNNNNDNHDNNDNDNNNSNNSKLFDY